VIKAAIFGLDGTLVQTERLKALSNAHAVIQLCPNGVTEADVLEVFEYFITARESECAQGVGT
jgi:beta-phosphoglucomutase